MEAPRATRHRLGLGLVVPLVAYAAWHASEMGRFGLSDADSFYPDLEPSVHEPAGLARAYARVMHVPRWLLGVLTGVSSIGLFLPALTRGRLRLAHRREIFLLAGGAICVLIGATATSDFVLRYLIPVVPLLLAAGVATASELVRLAHAKSAARPKVAA